MELKTFFAIAGGQPLPGATCSLYLPGTGTLAAGLQDKNGNPLSNPFEADAYGLVQFAAPDGKYDLHVVHGARELTLRIQCMDLAPESEKFPAIVAVTGSREFNLADVGNYLVTSASAAMDLTIPPQAEVSWPANCEIHIEQGAAGAVTLAAAAGVTLQHGESVVPTTREAHSPVTLKRKAEDVWVVFGALVAAE